MEHSYKVQDIYYIKVGVTWLWPQQRYPLEMIAESEIRLEISLERVKCEEV